MSPAGVKVTTFAEADAFLGTRQSRKLANNTWLERRVFTSAWGTFRRIAVRLHETDVVTYLDDESIMLDSGGWLTSTTKNRINTFLPKAIRVHSDKGRWYVTTHLVRKVGIEVPDFSSSTGFCDRMLLWREPFGQGFSVANAMTEDLKAREDAHNRMVEVLLDRWIRKLRKNMSNMAYANTHKSGVWYEADDNAPGQIQHTRAEGCGFCVRTGVGRMVADEFEDTQHLIEHLQDGKFPYDLLRVACEQQHPHGFFRLSADDLVMRDVRTYLRQRLYTGHVAIAHGKRPRFAMSRSIIALEATSA